MTETPTVHLWFQRAACLWGVILPSSSLPFWNIDIHSRQEMVRRKEAKEGGTERLQLCNGQQRDLYW